MRIYLTGGTGFLGSNIIRVAREQFDAGLFTTTHNWRPMDPVDFAFARVDVGDRQGVLRSVREYEPDVIIHSAIQNDFNAIYRDRRLAWREYVEATHHLTDAANELGVKIILVSTDWVFDGTQPGADETTPPNPINYYGVLKLASERVVAERAQNWAIARVAGVNGVHWLRRDRPPAQNEGYGQFAGAVLTALRHGRPFVVWLGDNINHCATPSLASESAAMILEIARLDKQGIFHCTGGESIDRLEFARKVTEVFGFDPGMIQKGAPAQPLPPGARIPYDTSLSAEQTSRELNRPLLRIRPMLERFKRQVESGEL